MTKSFPLSVLILQLLVIIHIASELQCPVPSQWQFMARGRCNAIEPWYYCLFNENSLKYTDFCRNKQDFHQPGYKYVVSGNINGKPCDLERFQPFKFKTDGNSRCVFEKSVCNEEGQVNLKNGTTISDRTCRCDYTGGYAFVTKPANICFCVPSQEDCSCFKKHCTEKEILTPDYDCVETDHLIDGYSCPFIWNKRLPGNSPKIEHPNHKVSFSDTSPQLERDNTGLCIGILLTIVLAINFVWWSRVAEHCRRFILMNTIIDNEVNRRIETKLKNDQREDNEEHISPRSQGKFMSTFIEKRIEDGIQKYINENTPIQHNEEVIPPEVKEIHDQHVDKWRKDDRKFIKTAASKNVEKQLRDNKCVLVVGRSGNGKSSIIRHLALSIQDEKGYQIIPTVKSPSDILAFNDQKRNQIFIIDDLLGKDMINAQAADEWTAQLDEVFILLNAASQSQNKRKPFGDVKLLFATGVDLYNDNMFQRLNPIKNCVCDLSNWPLNDKEKMAMIRNYISPESQSKLTKKLNSDEAYFPLLCKIAEGKTADQIIRLFSNLNDFIKHDLLALKRTNHLKFCIVTLCAILNNKIKEDLLTEGNEFDIERKIFENICIEFNLGSQLEPVQSKIKEQLKNLEGMYLAKTENYYHFIHSKVYRTAVLVCGQASLYIFIKFILSSYIAERFCFESSITDSNQDSVILIDDEYTEKTYFDRLMADLEQGVTYSAIHNCQLRNKSYREKFCLYCQNRKQKVSELLKRFNSNSDALTKNVSFENMEDYEDYIDFEKQNHFSSHKMRKPLIESAWEGYADIIQILLDSGCNINDMDKFGRTALFVACFFGNDDVVCVLLRNNANHSLYDKNRQSPLFVASREGYHKIVKVLIQNSADVNLCNVNGDSPLLIASSEGHLWTVQTLLREVQDFSKCNNLGQTPVFLASMNGRTDVLKYLFSSHFSEYISKSDNEGRSPLFIGCMGGHHAVVQFLLENHADISQCDWSKRSPLFIASAEGHANIVKLLIQNNANINHCDEEGMTPLFIAAEKGRTEIASFLIDSGANINITDHKRRSPFYAACRRGFISIVQLLHAHNARTSECNKWGGSALFAACREGHFDIAKFLIKIGADISAPDCNGTTPLLVSCENGNTEIVNLLINNGANVNEYDNDKKTPLNAVIAGGLVDLRELLLNNGAQYIPSNDNS